MTHRTLLIIGALTISLLAGCSKRPLHSAWTSSDSMAVDPRVSVGPVHSGMTMQQVVAEVGEPDGNKAGVLLYRTLGFEVCLNKEGKVQEVVCGAAGNAEFAKSFGGHTKEGIGIGSTHAEVLSAYGKPTTRESNQKMGLELLRYDSRGIVFILSDDKVNRIYVRIKP